MMESNRDEAERCIQIAMDEMDEGRMDRAEKFLKKAEALYPTNAAKDLLEKLKQFKTQTKNEKKHTPAADEGLHKRKTSTSPGSPKPERFAEIDYTIEQLEVVKSVKKCKDYYEVLGLSKEATDSEIKKAYKKLALQLHPDKNKAPGSVEAFKAVGNAVAILTDPEKRKSYDLYGSEEQQNVRTRRTHTEYGYSRGFETDVTAEELFNMFFGGGFPQQQQTFVYSNMRPRTRFHRQQEAHQREQQQSGYAALINLLPIILLIGLSMMSSFFISDPIYSLSPSQKFSIQRKTNALKVPYYVRDNFHQEYQGSVGRLEASVEEEYIHNLKHSCFREKTYKDNMLTRARNFGDRDMYQKAQLIQTPSCDTLNRLHGS